jgi:hypothetical protein
VRLITWVNTAQEITMERSMELISTVATIAAATACSNAGWQRVPHI